MAARNMDQVFELVTPDHADSRGYNVTLPGHLSPETSAVAMEIRWFKGTDCIYLYKNGHVTVREGYEGRVRVNTQELQRGVVSLRLRQRRWGDRGVYTCQVISGEHKEEGRVGLTLEKEMKREITAEERKKMEDSVQSLLFELVTPDHAMEFTSLRHDIFLPARLSPETSAVAMEIRWFNNTDCIYLYKNGHVTAGRGYEGGVSVDIKELLTGDVSLTLSSGGDPGVPDEDIEVFTCQVISGEQMKEGKVGLDWQGLWDDPIGPNAGRAEEEVREMLRREITAEERKRMEKSVQSLALLAWQKATDELMEKNNQLAEMEKIKQQLEEKNKDMEKTNQQLEEKNEEMEKTNQQLEEKNKEMEKTMKQQLEDKNKLEERDRQLEEREREHLTDPDPPHVRRRHSMDPNMGGESPVDVGGESPGGSSGAV